MDLIVNRLQDSLNTWEGTLNATLRGGGARQNILVPDRFCLGKGHWRYKSFRESPETLTVKDLSGFRKTLTRHEV